MSRKYEGLIVLNTKGIETSIDELVSTVGKEIEAEGAKLEEVKQLGRRQFAYASNKLESGHYVNYLFSAEPAAIDAITKRLKLNEQVHLQHFQVR
ncbi:MAG: 30S ribosomal protein S6 [Akkermansiaceae bacterium]|jgi:small subunit ribosomal protein S6|nr:30S ribosomal protein S6 [Akkermansiaceae bacterium]